MSDPEVQLLLAQSGNRDPMTTTLTLAKPGDTGTFYQVDVNPVELFRAAIQNLPTPLDERFEWFLNVMIERIEAEVELQS